MKTLTMEQAIQEALFEEMARDPRVLFLGEGVVQTAPQLHETYGPKRVRNTPLSEGIIAGTSAGVAAMGFRPVMDLLFSPFLCYAMDQLVNSAGKLRYISGGQFSFPLVALVRTGCGLALGAHHNHNNEAWFVHAPGLKVVFPSSPAAGKALVKSAIRDGNPVIVFRDMILDYIPAEVPDEEPVIPLGKAAVLRPGTSATIVSYGRMVYTALQAAGELDGQGISAEVIDLQTLKPLDEETVLASVRKTGRLVVVHEANRTCGVGAELAAIVAEKAFESLKAPVRRITSPDVPAPASAALEQAFMPQADEIVETVQRLVG